MNHRKVRRFGIWTRLLGASLSALLMLVAVFQGRELCFCEKVLHEGCQTEHCLACEPCSCMAAVDGGEALLVNDDCDDFEIGEAELWLSGDCFDCVGLTVAVAWFPPPESLRLPAVPDGLLPPTTAPPDPGGGFTGYCVRALPRS